MKKLLSRRRFIQLIGALGGAQMVGCANSPAPRAAAKVVVVGGGFAGATLAKYLRLLDNGIEVSLVEQNQTYYTCPGSNLVLGGLATIDSLARSYRALSDQYGVNIIRDRALAVDAEHKTVDLRQGDRLHYDRLVICPGIDFRWDALAGYDRSAENSVPHAWKAGPQTGLLWRQIVTMQNGGVIIIAPPPKPFRCPPGPYERASLIAYYLKTHKPRSKVLIVDSNTSFTKQALFQSGWKALYPDMIEWISPGEEGMVERVDVNAKTLYTEFGKHRADVLNLIPAQQAGAIAQQAGLCDASGWCPVDCKSFNSKLLPDIYVLGDACNASPMPKSAFSANSQAKVCAQAIVASIQGHEASPPSMINTCYSLLAPEYGISIAAVYEYEPLKHELIATSSGVTAQDADRRLEALYAHSWYQNITADVFN